MQHHCLAMSMGFHFTWASPKKRCGHVSVFTRNCLAESSPGAPMFSRTWYVIVLSYTSLMINDIEHVFIVVVLSQVLSTSLSVRAHARARVRVFCFVFNAHFLELFVGGSC